MLTVEEQVRLIADAAMDALDLDTAAEQRATPGETVLDQMPGPDTSSPVQFTEEVVTMIDVKTTDPTQPGQKRPMRVVVAGILAAAAAVVAVAFVVIRDADEVTPTDEPSTTVTVPPTTPPRALLGATPGERFVPGTYFVEVDGTPTARIFVTIGAEWSGTSPPMVGVIFKEGIGVITFSRPDAVFSDACHWSDGYHPGPVATLDGLVAALSEQAGWADVTAPADISIDGYASKAFQRIAPAELSDCSTSVGISPRIRPPGWTASAPLPVFRSWQSENFGGEFYEPGEIETLWVLDLDGTVVVINTRLFPSVTTGATALAGPSAAARAEVAAVLDSIRIDRG